MDDFCDIDRARLSTYINSAIQNRASIITLCSWARPAHPFFEEEQQRAAFRHITMALGRIKLIYRSCLFQIVIVGLVSLCEPGIWTALNNLGAGGQASVSLVHRQFPI